MFTTQQTNAAGIYQIRFFINGMETPVVVDDYLPVKQDGTPAFATSRDGELWVSLLEKAWAKLHGSYARMEGGLPSHAAIHLAGVPAESHFHDDIAEDEYEDFFEQVESADKRNFIMMAASRDSGESDGKDGVVTGHAYSLISVHRLEHEGRQIKLFKLRNPWGSGEWTGAWSDNSSDWTEELKNKVNFTNANDGIFFIELSDYLQHFQWTSICVNNAPMYKHSRLQHCFSNEEDDNTTPQAFFKFTLANEVDSKQKAFAISVQQQGDRLKNYRMTDQNRKFEPSCFNISLMTDSGEFVMGRQGGQNFNFSLLSEQETLKPGTYIIMVDPLWNKSAELNRAYKDVIIDIYAPEAISIDQMGDVAGFQCFAKALKRHAL